MGLQAGIIDYGSGNFTSVYNTVSSITNSVKTITVPEDFSSCSHIILPGVGAYAAAMEKINQLNLLDALNDEVMVKKKPVLGICVGFQLMAEFGLEFGQTPGFGWLNGNVKKFEFNSKSMESLPHIGWNDTEDFEGLKLFKGIDQREPSFYFVHSYHFCSNTENEKAAYCNYGYRFIAAVEKENIFGVQFHPEKSQVNGIRLLTNFLEVDD